ncbi:MAG: peptidoglycan-associated lipoprotein Pal [Candidatus Dadabacteria bacterium]|nr:MAG: peptidoglycan-associated lipoprotein Pal [Candidatus Dadabacteria bacterium]
MGRMTLRWAVVGMLLAALAVGGCAKKQVRQEGETAAPAAKVTPVKPAPAPKPVVRETPKPAPAPEPPPARTGAVEPAPEKPVEGAGLAQETTPGLERIHFDFDKAVIRPDAQEVLRKNAEYLQNNPGVRIRIEGHCDERGTTEYNLALGERRAKAAFQYLMDLGIDPNRMSVVSYGEEMPLDPRHNEEAWAKNRRAEFVEVGR